MTEVICLKWYHTFVFLFQTALSLADIVTDALTCRTYFRQKEFTRFGLGLALIVVPMIVTALWSIVASTTRILDNEDADEMEDVGEADVFFRGTVLNVCLSCFCLGPTLHSLELFLYCARNFQALWKSKNGIKVSKDHGSVYYLYMHNMNMKLVEGLLESAPQLTLQIYAMVKQNQPIETIQVVSASISFLSFTWMITTNEDLRERTGYNKKLLHTIAIFISNLGLVAGRTCALIFFAVAFGWWLSLIICAHWAIMVLIGFAFWTSKRRQDIVCFIFAYSFFYIFVFRLYMLKKIRGETPLGCPKEYLVTILWHFLFAAENVTMILTYFFYHNETGKWYDNYVVILVVAGTFAGIVIKVLMWYFCFKDNLSSEWSERARPMTILLRTERIRGV